MGEVHDGLAEYAYVKSQVLAVEQGLILHDEVSGTEIDFAHDTQKPELLDQEVSKPSLVSGFGGHGVGALRRESVPSCDEAIVDVRHAPSLPADP